MCKSNGERAEHAREALQAFMFSHPAAEYRELSTLETPLVDLLADIQHLCDELKLDYSRLASQAGQHYQAEAR